MTEEEELADRAEFVKGMRLLAAYVEQHEDLPTPTFGWSGASVSCYVSKESYKKITDETGHETGGWYPNFESDEAHAAAQVARFNEVCRAMIHSITIVDGEGQVVDSQSALGNFQKKSDDYHIEAVRQFSKNVKLTCQLAHETASCEQVVTGTRVVKEPDPETVKAIRAKAQAEIDALEKVEQVKEDKKWICPPSLLALPAEASVKS